MKATGSTPIIHLLVIDYKCVALTTSAHTVNASHRREMQQLTQTSTSSGASIDFIRAARLSWIQLLRRIELPLQLANRIEVDLQPTIRSIDPPIVHLMSPPSCLQCRAVSS
jgi:hypothetical protein